MLIKAEISPTATGYQATDPDLRITAEGSTPERAAFALRRAVEIHFSARYPDENTPVLIGS